MRFTNIIQEWFKKEWGGSLVLPDGWFGRPYDNQHSLTSVEESGDELRLILDEKLLLHFTGLKSVQARGHELIFGPFEELRFEWEGFGLGAQREVKQYKTGETTIISAPG